MNFQLIADAALTQQEFADATQFSRPSVNLWINGRKTPGRRAQAILRAAEQTLREAIDAGALPFKDCDDRAAGLQDLKRKIAVRAVG